MKTGLLLGLVAVLLSICPAAYPGTSGLNVYEIGGIRFVEKDSRYYQKYFACIAKLDEFLNRFPIDYTAPEFQNTAGEMISAITIQFLIEESSCKELYQNDPETAGAVDSTAKNFLEKKLTEAEASTEPADGLLYCFIESKLDLCSYSQVTGIIISLSTLGLAAGEFTTTVCYPCHLFPSGWRGITVHDLCIVMVGGKKTPDMFILPFRHFEP